MVGFDPDNDPRLIRSIECGLLDITEETRALISEAEWRAALHRQLHLDIGDQGLNAWIGNLFGIAFLGAGIVVSSYPTSIGRFLKIHTDLERGERGVFPCRFS